MERIEQSALKRIKSAQHQQMRTVQAVRHGRPLAAENDQERLDARSAAIGHQMSIKSIIAAAKESSLHESLEQPPGGPERIWGNSIDFVGVAFLEQGFNAAQTTGRVAFLDGRAQGTGFLIAPGLFLTNNHVLGSLADAGLFVVEFDYEVGPDGQPHEICRFEFSPNELFITDDTNDLDYTVIAIGRKISGPKELDAFGFCPLTNAGDKHALGEVANIVQHPDGRFKEVVLRENRLISRLSHVLHYVADTEPGSSGSPVFNNQWQAIALHHWGGPWRQRFAQDGSPLPRFVNEGIRISAIVDELQLRLGELSPSQRDRLENALQLGENVKGRPQAPQAATVEDGNETGVHLRADGTAVWRLPIEISVGLPAATNCALNGAMNAAAAAVTNSNQVPQAEAFRRRVDPNYDNRRGYRERFLHGHIIPMPQPSDAVRARLAVNQDAEAGDDPNEFPYQHFSVYVDSIRGLPLATACNIDGRNLKNINRRTGRVTRAENIETESRPEAREKWYDDPRINEDECGDDDLYTRQVVSAGPNRVSRIFHRGHMVRRLDPCWGSDSRALRAEADTFHFTNCTPQVGRFNTNQTLWQGIENQVLDNARIDDIRVTVFTGTVLDDDDPLYRNDVFDGFRVPLKFWKIAVWEDDGELSALAMIADQSDALRELPETAEAIDDDEGVRDFVTTVIDIEQLTGLDFGEEVREADLYQHIGGGESAEGFREITDFEDINLHPKKKRRRKKPQNK